MNIAHIEEQSFIYGPNCRFVIWVQGCSIHCKGCWNYDMWDFKDRNILSVPEILMKIKNEINLINGITLLGGEPLDQFNEVLELINETKKLGLSTMLFTGYKIEEIKTKKMDSILNQLDILVSGPYVKNLRTLNHQWIGSTNQEIHFLSDKYTDYKIQDKNYIEITINENGSTNLLGFIEKDMINSLL